ncbi:TolC family protein [Asticcacaulis sp. YBE204]|uniref:TolC family protein n=1 Tax=Asticcacaulis sp. YBE204 TaxID=1282363 RepID=UPI001F211A34|nr:TolC family protein [Asticcacaulis sp. YBE204]
MTEALTLTANADPTATATNRRLAAADANIRQAGVRPNPSVGLEAENFLGSNPYNGLNSAEFTLTYQQPLERKSKRQARVGAATAEKDLVRAEGRARTWQAMTAAQVLWVEAAAAEAEIAVAQERLLLAERSQAEIARRVSAARDPLFAGSLANTDVANARIAIDQAKAKARQLKLQLASFWGGGADFTIDPAVLETTISLSGGPTLLETPDIEVLRAQQRVSTAQIRVETTRRVQDPTFSAGIRNFREDGSVAFLIGGTIPLNRFDRNQGNIDRTRAEAEAAAADIEVAERLRLRDIAAVTIRMNNAVEEVRRIDAEVIPQAEKAVAQVREGFARGGFTYRDVIGAQETLIAAKARRVEVLKIYQLDKAERDRLIGQWVPLIQSESNP